MRTDTHRGPGRWAPLLTALLTLCCFAAAAARAEDLNAVHAALGALQSSSLDGWAFTRTTTRKDKVTVERFDPTAPPGAAWRLLSVNGGEPSAKELKKYASRRESKRGNLPKIEIEEWVEPGSLALLSADGAAIAASFAVPSDPGDEDPIELAGELAIDPASGQIARLRQHNTAVYKPAPGVKLKHFEVVAEFQQLDPSTTLLKRVQMRAEGRAFGLKKISQKEIVEFSDFARVDAR